MSRVNQLNRRILAAARAPGLSDGFTGQSGRVGMAKDLAAAGVELPELMTAGWWKSSSFHELVHQPLGDSPAGPTT